jgi:hypothetical protein
VPATTTGVGAGDVGTWIEVGAGLLGFGFGFRFGFGFGL